MIPALSIGLSGLRAAQARMDVAAHHVANMANPGLERQQVVQAPLAAGGVGIRIEAAAGHAGDLAADLVEQRQALHLYTANLRTVQTVDRLFGSLLDTFA